MTASGGERTGSSKEESQMKRILSLITAVMLITLTACGRQTENPAASTPPPDTSPLTQPSDPVELPGQEGEAPQTEHILIAYFSLWDNAPEYTDTGTSASVVAEAQAAAGTNAYVARMTQGIGPPSSLRSLIRRILTR